MFDISLINNEFSVCIINIISEQSNDNEASVYTKWKEKKKLQKTCK